MLSYWTLKFNIKLQKRLTTWIALCLPLLDVFTDHIFAFLNAIKMNSPAVAAIGVASLFNLAFGPMIYGKKNFMSWFLCHGWTKFFKVALYGTGIRYDRSKKGRLGNFLYCFKKIISIIFASVIFLVEEMQNVFLYYKECSKVQLLAKKQNIFKHLHLEERKQVKKFYNAKIQSLNKAQKLICREATIQVALQLTLILYQEILRNHLYWNSTYLTITFTLNIYHDLLKWNFYLRVNEFVHFPAIEFQYSEFPDNLKFVTPTFLWIIGLILQIITTLTTAYSTFSVIIDRLFLSKIKVFRHYKVRFRLALRNIQW